MKFLIEVITEVETHIALHREDNFLCIETQEGPQKTEIFLDEFQLFELIGALHHIQKQIKSMK